MESNGATPPPPPPPSPQQPPAPPLTPLWAPAPAGPPKPARQEDFGVPSLVLRVSNRLLWVGEAVYPLHLYVAQPTVNIGHYTHVGDTANISGSGNIGVVKK